MGNVTYGGGVCFFVSTIADFPAQPPEDFSFELFKLFPVVSSVLLLLALSLQ